MKKVIVTGASGLIGRALVELLVNKGIQVTAIVRPDSSKNATIIKNPLVMLESCDISDVCSLENELQNDYDVFFHFAWEGVYGKSRNDEKIQNNNLVNTLNALKVAKKLGCSRFVCAGSQAEYGVQNVKLTPYTPTNPITEYGKAKLRAFEEGKLLAKKLGIDFLWGRIISAYGPNDSTNTMITNIIKKMINNETCDLSMGRQIWDYIYSEDVARAFYLISEKGNSNKPYPIGSGEGHQLREYIETMLKLAKSNSKLNFGAVPMSAMNYLVADLTEITKDTGFVPEITFEKGIQNTIEWVRVNR